MKENEEKTVMEQKVNVNEVRSGELYTLTVLVFNEYGKEFLPENSYVIYVQGTTPGSPNYAAYVKRVTTLEIQIGIEYNVFIEDAKTGKQMTLIDPEIIEGGTLMSYDAPGSKIMFYFTISNNCLMRMKSRP